MVAAKKVTTCGIHGKLRELQRICEDGGETVPTTIVDLIELDREGIKSKRKITTMTSRQTE